MVNHSPIRSLPQLILLILLISSACSTLPTQAPPGGVSTLAAQTWTAHEAQLTPSDTARPTSTPGPPTATLRPTATKLPTDTPIPCDRAEFIKHINYSEETILPPGAVFTKTWQVRNSGTCPWKKSYQIIPVIGDTLGSDVTTLSAPVPPGKTVDISLRLTAPEEPGAYQGTWLLQSDLGTIGFSSAIGQMLSTRIRVEETSIVEESIYETITYNFANNYCSAYWENEVERLPCPGKEGLSSGFVLLLVNPELENRKENEPTLWTHPQQIPGGSISGTFPPIGIQTGDSFLAEVGCLGGYTQCNVSFQLAVRVEGGPLQILDEWFESHDGEGTIIDEDLSSFAGKSVTFVFLVLGFGPQDQNAAYWLMPQIRHSTKSRN